MPSPKSWNLAQRIVLVVAAALVLKVVAHWVLYRSPGGGWFGYAPQTIDTLSGFPEVARYDSGTSTFIALGFIGVWVAISFWILRDHEESE